MVKRKRSPSHSASRLRRASTTSSLSSVPSTSSSISRSEKSSSPHINSSTSSTAVSELGSEARTDAGKRCIEKSTQSLQNPQPDSLVNVTKGGAHNIQVAVNTSNERRTTGLSTPPRAPESSHEGTVISPDVTNSLQTVTSSMIYTATDSYPVFSTSDVFIQCNLVNPPKQWRLHSAILDRHSSWFRHEMQIASRNRERSGSLFFFLLEEHNGNMTLVLQEGRSAPRGNDSLPFTVKAEATETSSNTEAIPTPPVSTTTSISVSKLVSTADANTHVPDHEARTNTVEIYNQILGSFYSIPLRIPSETLTQTLTTCESLLKISQNLACTPLISAQITISLQHHRYALFTAIASDPARYLVLATNLENDAMYTESLIHIIGAHPSWPWPTKREVLPAYITKLVDRKSEELDRLCTDIERELLLLTIQVANRSVEPLEHSQFDTWFVVQVFRDTLARTFHGLDGSSSKSLKRGTLFRKIKRGGAEYMPYEEVRRLMSRIMPSAVENLEEDLGLLKEFASGIVEDVARNEALVDVEREKVGWLTCTTVGREDIPWRAAGGEKEGGVE